MLIELLYFDGCPSWQDGLENLKAALSSEGLQAEIRLVRVESNADAARLKFLGSPSFRVDGMDLYPEERNRYNMSCRVYATPQGIKGAPTAAMLRERLRVCKPK
ncbi:MAG: thioredoxin family protein [Chloroflexi bacterium]|nr:thioredoxin family protein [Chloroflexota bacterium]